MYYIMGISFSSPFVVPEKLSLELSVVLPLSPCPRSKRELGNPFASHELPEPMGDELKSKISWEKNLIQSFAVYNTFNLAHASTFTSDRNDFSEV